MIQNKMVGAASHRFHHTFHFELEKQRRNLTDRQVGMHTQYIYLEIVGLLQQTDDFLFFGR